MDSTIEKHREEMAVLCRRLGVRRLDLFGSAAREDFDPSHSDVDFFYEFDADRNGLAERFFRLLEGLEQMVGRAVDLVSIADATNPFFLNVANQHRVTIYAA